MEETKNYEGKSLVWPCFSWGAKEIDLFEFYLSRLEPSTNNKEGLTVEATLPELGSLIVDKGCFIDMTQIKKSLQKLITTVELYDETIGLHSIYPLFDEIEMCFDDDWRKTKISFVGNKYIRDQILGFKNNGDIRNRLQSIIALKNPSAKRLYSILKDKCYYTHEWTIEIENLKEQINVNKNSYKNFAEFNRSCLSAYVQNINEETDLDVEYITLREGRNVKYIKFIISEKHNIGKLLNKAMLIRDSEIKSNNERANN